MAMECFRINPQREPIHSTQNSRRANDKHHQVLVVGPGEDAVTIQVELDGHIISAMLATGARPSVIDCNTLKQLNLDQEVIEDPSEVFGLCDSPIEVLGYIDVRIGFENHPPVRERQGIGHR